MKKYLQLFLDALKGGEHQDYTRVSLNKAIFLLAVPMIIEMVFESLFAVVDAYFVASTIGVNAAATVSLVESVVTLIYAIAIGLSAAATALVSRRMGEQKPGEASRVVGQIILLTLIFSLLIGSIGYLNAERVLRAMGASEEVVSSGLRFTEYMFLSSPAIMFLWTLGGALRGAGDASSAMKSLIIANLINIILDYLLIVKWQVGVEGAAIATTIGRSVGVGYQFYALVRKGQPLSIKVHFLRPDLPLIRHIVSIGAGGTGQFLIASASWVFLTRILAGYGSEVLAGYNIAIRLLIFTILPAWGLANAAATLVGQNLGAGKPEQAEAAVWKIGRYTMFFLLAVGIFFFVMARPVASLFIQNTIAVDIAAKCLKVFCLGYLFFGYGMVIGQSLNGAGDTRSPTILNLICFWLIEIPLAYIFARVFNWGPDGVFWAIAFSESLLAVLAIWVFKRGRWKTLQV